MNEKELEALIRLLDDTDEEVFHHVCKRLVVLGEPAIPRLEEVWETSFDHLIQRRIEDIIHQIQFDKIVTRFEAWKKDPGNLLEGAMLVARYQYPDLDEKPLKKVLRQIVKHIRAEINSRKTATEKVKLINHILYDVYGFSGNKANLHAPHNYYINHVIETKKGNHLTLGILYIYLAGEIGLTIKGINIPDHFILGYMDKDPVKQIFSVAPHQTPAFYINPFSKGTIFSKREVDHYLKQVGAGITRDFYLPSPEISIVQRMIYHLKDIYKELGFENKEQELTKLARILDA